MGKSEQVLKIASAEDFDPTEIVQLPSQIGTDKAVKLRRPDVFELISGGDAPDILTNLALNQIDGGVQDIEINADTMPALVKTLNLIAKAVWVEPEGVEVTSLAIKDRMFIFNWALGAEYQSVESFRAEQNGNVPAVSEV